MEGCFFCEQSEDRLQRVLYETEHFYVLLGLGPIVEGFALLVAKEHTRSMFDLPEDKRAAYLAEKNKLKRLIEDTYHNSVIVTEHGRVQACVVEDEEAHDKLCYHAHQLFFPIGTDLSALDREGPFTKVFEDSSLFHLPASDLQEHDEYLLFENQEGHVFVFRVNGKCPRQYMRYLVARSVGQPELASWQRFPDREKILAAKEKYLQVLATQKPVIEAPIPVIKAHTLGIRTKKRVNKASRPLVKVRKPQVLSAAR